VIIDQCNRHHNDTTNTKQS